MQHGIAIRKDRVLGDSSLLGEGDRRRRLGWRGTRRMAHAFGVRRTGLCPSPILRMVPLPVSGRI